MIKLICAIDNNNGIGKNNNIPWNLKQDLKHFAELTKGHNVIMGRKTWESLHNPLSHRNNYIITSNNTISSDNTSVFFKKSIQDAISQCKKNSPNNDIFIIGGEKIFEEVLNKGLHSQIYLTRIYKKFDCDTFFPNINYKNNKLIYESDIYEDNNTNYQYLIYENIIINQEEQNYLDLLHNVIYKGKKRYTRNGNVRSIFQPPQLEFDLTDGKFPALTSKKMWIKGILLELQWFLSGSTNSNDLNSKGCKIWNGNTSREFLDKRGLTHFNVGEIGETYGFLFRKFGADYYNSNKQCGFDQVQSVIDKIRHNPDDRRLIINLFKPDALNNCALPPCLCWYQFYVDDNDIDLYMYIRSSDICLGLPWNILTGALMNNLIANVCNKKPRRLIIGLGDVHIYEQHIDIFEKQLHRKLKKFPTLNINKKLKTIDDIINLNYNDITINNYDAHPTIIADMIV